MNMLDHALTLLKDYNLPIFPVSWDDKRKSKDPIEFAKAKRKKACVDWMEYMKRLPTEAEVRRWWNQWPDAGIAMACGELSGITVIDAENGADYDRFGLRELNIPTVKSGGDGIHWYFKYSKEDKIINQTKFVDLYDVKTEAGYVLLPPSLHESGNRYDWIIHLSEAELIPLPDDVKKAIHEHMGSEGSSGKSNILKYLNEPIKEGSRNSSAASVCGKLVLRFKQSELLDQAWPLFKSWNQTQNKPPLDEKELASVFESITKIDALRKKHDIKIEQELEPQLVDTEDDVVVTLPVDDGKVEFTFSEIKQARSDEMNCLLTTRLIVPGVNPSPFNGRINILSMSALGTYARQLKECFEEKVKWNHVLSVACSKVSLHKSAKTSAIWLADVPEEADEKPLYYPFLVDGPTIIFGKGGTGKTYISIRLAISIATGITFLDYAPEETKKVLFVDYESTAKTFQKRLYEICTSVDVAEKLGSIDLKRSFRYLDPQGTPLTDLIPQLKKEVKENNIGFIVVDSAVMACGNEPEKADTAANYFNALKAVGVPSLTIAHETKAENHAYPFGSVFWWNCPRSIWNIEAQDAEESINQVCMKHLKANDSNRHGIVPIRVNFGIGYTEIGKGDLSLWEEKLSVKQRILRILGRGPRTLETLVTDLEGEKKKTIKDKLTILANEKKVKNDAGFWIKI